MKIKPNKPSDNSKEDISPRTQEEEQKGNSSPVCYANSEELMRDYKEDSYEK